MCRKIRLTISMVVAIAVGLTFITGCGEEEDDEENANNLIGDWVTDCAKDDEQNATGYHIETITFTGTDFVYHGQQYSDATCATFTGAHRSTGTYLTGDAAASETKVEGATEIDIKFTKIEMATTDANMISTFNEYCNPTTAIVSGEYFDFSTLTCPAGDDDDDDGPGIGDTYYEIFKATDVMLLWGEDEGTNNGSTAALRPTALGGSEFKKR